MLFYDGERFKLIFTLPVAHLNFDLTATKHETCLFGNCFSFAISHLFVPT